ncbi:cornulin [Colius striatus]|uniref:cornulin n=1 Tax=Colius striatus TaxID=57412 RepID=UPI002B1D5227|nr:cornulin [Colius striatus]
MSQLQENINGIVAAFYRGARSDGNCSPLSREELRQLMEEQFADAMENPQDPKTVKKVVCFLEDDSNCRVDFTELLSLVFCVAKACYKPLQQHQKLEDGQEPTGQEKAEGEQPSGPHAVGKVPSNQEVPEQGQDTETQDADRHQSQEGETPEHDWDHRQDDGTEAPEVDPERGEILYTATPEQDRNIQMAGEADTPKQDPKTQETEALRQGLNHHQSPEMESAEQNLNCPSEIQGRDPNNETQVCKAPWQDPNPHKTQELPLPEQGPSPHGDTKPWGTHHTPACHQLPEPKVLEHSGVEALACPARQQQPAHHQRQPAMEQQLLQSLYQWPPQQ